MKLKEEERVFEKRGHYANSLIAYIVSLFFVVAVVLLILVGVLAYQGNKNWIYCLVCLASVCSFLVFSNYFFVWAKNCKFIKKKDYIEYVFDDVVSTFGNSKVSYKILEVTKYKKDGKNVIIYGDFSEKYPLRKRKSVKKCILYNIDDESLNWLKSNLRG